ncbi:response regulator transcription factor [Mesorhizobium sp. B2-2-4]|nr:response regulator transcription factor [Mesorhizobium sp. B2-8-1]TPJ39536.1 response regulator transcription factor [Mesorhizobium sp. B2-6-6]TPJ46832.1 response regulator transcription factor [Mesorhizobium sp. B2-6-4]TPJ57969.1 response regulator transcription factor [Mesorhizobium sp. B2-6-1]TPJ95880.1 response regulator transcription factor [Mesorhizobium sp. B2-5-12]TPK20027.1 response regulator transcription factor [Mesorhizobium sp. B2-5-6]TPK41182.1 response regulator transcriptio
MMFIPNLLSTESGSERIVRARILIVEDEPDLREAVAEYLGAAGYDVATAETAAAARSLVETQSFHLAILDIAMPGEDGLSLGRWLRSRLPIGIIYATAAGTALDRIVGLELGADDYIVKPYELREVLARVRSVLRRVPQHAPMHGQKASDPRRSVAFGSFQADLDGRLVTGANGAVIDMAKSEFDVLEVFLTRANRLLTRAAISEAIGLTEDPESSRAVDIRIMRLRKKIETDPASPKFLRTVRGEGYIFSLPAGDGH